MLAISDSTEIIPEEPLDSVCVTNDSRAVLNHDTINELISLAPNQDFLNRLLDKMKQDGTRLINSMSDAVNDNDAEQFSALAHALKGSAANLGLIQLQTEALTAENTPPAQLTEQGAARIDQLQSAFDLGIEELTKQINKQQLPV